MKRLRQVGKQAILGLGYGMGAKKFMDTLRRDCLAGHLFATGELNPTRCRQIVQTFRSAYPCIPQFWHELEEAVRTAIDGVRGSVGILQVLRDQDDILVMLPSGRALRYADPRLDWTMRSISYLAADGTVSEFTPDGPSIVLGNGTHLYGGKLCENVVQATARDLLVEAILHLEAAGMPVVFHVHDEVVVEVPEMRAADAQKTVGHILRTPPPWATGLPVDCEVNTTSRYGK